MRERGKVGFFGFSGLGETAALHELVDSGEFHGFQCYYNLLNPSAGQPVPQNSARRTTVSSSIAPPQKEWALSSFASLRPARSRRIPARRRRQRQTLSPGSDYPLDLQRAEKVKAALGVDGKDLTQAAIRFGLMNPKVSTVLVGFSNTTHVDEAVACSGAPGLSEEQMAR